MESRKVFTGAPDLIREVTDVLVHRNQRGIALIVAIAASLILFLLVATLCLLSTATSRQSNYAKKATIALHLAEAGVADAMYRLNYCSSGNYPFENTRTPFPTADSPVISTGDGITDGFFYDGSLEGGTYKVTFNDNVGSNDTDKDKITSIGSYKGIKKTLSVFIRGTDTLADPRQNAASTQGIAEAFNKHVIYCKTFNASGTREINGNKCMEQLGTISGTSDGDWTYTLVPQIEVPIPSSLIPASPPAPPEPSNSTWDQTFISSDNDVSGVTYSISPTEEKYTLIDCSIQRWLCEQTNTDTPLLVEVSGNSTTITSNGFLEAQKKLGSTTNASITLDFNTTNPNLSTLSTGHIKAGSNIAINSGVANPSDIGADSYAETEPILYAGGDININYSAAPGPVINGDIGAGGTIILQGPTIYGSALANNTVQLLNAASHIYGDVSSTGGIITLESTSGGSIIKGSLFATNNITLAGAASAIYGDSTYGVSDKSATIITTSNSGNITVGIDDLKIYSYNANKGAIIAYTSSGDAAINIGNTGTVNIDGLVYAYGSGTGSITLGVNTGNINGCLVANDTVNLNGGTLTWDSSNYKSLNIPLYQGFSGGRRVYLPVLGSWSQE